MTQTILTVDLDNLVLVCAKTSIKDLIGFLGGLNAIDGPQGDIAKRRGVVFAALRLRAAGLKSRAVIAWIRSTQRQKVELGKKITHKHFLDLERWHSILQKVLVDRGEIKQSDPDSTVAKMLNNEHQKKVFGGKG